MVVRPSGISVGQRYTRGPAASPSLLNCIQNDAQAGASCSSTSSTAISKRLQNRDQTITAPRPVSASSCRINEHPRGARRTLLLKVARKTLQERLQLGIRAARRATGR